MGCWVFSPRAVVGPACCDQLARIGLIAEKSQASVVPVSITGAEDLLGGPKRPVKIEFHSAIAPPQTGGRGKVRRAELDAMEIKSWHRSRQACRIASEGKFSTEPAAREAALAVSDFPFHIEELRGG